MKMNLKYFQIKTLKKRIEIYFVVLILIILIAIIGLVRKIFFDRITYQKHQVMNQKMEVITNQTSNQIQAFRDISYIIQKDKILSDEIKNGNVDSFYLSQTIKKLYQQTYGLQNLIPISKDLKVVDEFYGKPSLKGLIIETEDFKHFINTSMQSYFSLPNNFPSTSNYQKYYLNSNISLYSRLMDYSTYEVVGYTVMQIKRDYLFSGSRNLGNELFDYIYFTTKEGEILYSIGVPNEEVELKVTEVATKNGVRLKIGKEVYTVFSKTIKAYPQWRVVAVTSDTRFMKELGELNFYIMGIGIIAIAVVTLMSMYLSKKITYPVVKVTEAFKQVELGEIPEQLMIESKDELTYLVNGFNSMIKNMKILINTIYDEQTQKEEVEIERLKFELDSLQHQINPHFIYNTINTIAYVAKRDENEEITTLLQAFNLLLRTSMSNDKEFITLNEEITLIKSFLEIQKYRYGNIFKTVYQIQDEVTTCLVPKLILQPLVENALFHGIAACDEGGTITIGVIKEQEYIRIQVEDDGAGMDEETIEVIKNSKCKQGYGFNKVGVFNINERLKLYYGNEARLQIMSIKNKGTTIAFKIPYKINLY